MDLNPNAVWQSVFLSSLEAPIAGLGIQPLTLPLIFNNHLVMKVDSLGARPNWRLGAHASFLSQVGAIGMVAIERRYVPLGLSALALNYELSAFQLLLEFPIWHQHVDLQIWQQT